MSDVWEESGWEVGEGSAGGPGAEVQLEMILFCVLPVSCMCFVGGRVPFPLGVGLGWMVRYGVGLLVYDTP